MYQDEPMILDNQTLTRPHFVEADSTLSNIVALALYIKGKFNFNHVEVDEKLSVTGTMKGVDLTCNTLEVYGSLKGKKIKVRRGSISGPVQVGNSHFDTLEIVGLGAELSQSTVDNLFVHSSDVGEAPQSILSKEIQEDWVPPEIVPLTSQTDKKQQTIVLKNHSFVKNITFKEGNGLIYVDSTSEILGQVQGGKIIWGSPPCAPPILMSQVATSTATAVLSRVLESIYPRLPRKTI